MATIEVTGKTQDEIDSLREEYEEKVSDRYGVPDFEDKYCLARIPRQPDDYTGPQRYCASTNTWPAGSNWLCKHHGGATDGENEYDITQHDGSESIKHGMFATQENLINDFDDKDQALYNWILREYPKKYGIDLEQDPASQYDIHRLAVEIVRAERGRGFLIDEGEVKETEVTDENGRVVVDDNGEIVTTKSQHYLSDMLKDQDNKITKLEKELGISRRERQKHDQTDDAVDAIKGFAELGNTLLNRDSNDYDPDTTDKPWTDNNGPLIEQFSDKYFIIDAQIQEYSGDKIAAPHDMWMEMAQHVEIPLLKYGSEHFVVDNQWAIPSDTIAIPTEADADLDTLLMPNNKAVSELISRNEWQEAVV